MFSFSASTFNADMLVDATKDLKCEGRSIFKEILKSSHQEEVLHKQLLTSLWPHQTHSTNWNRVFTCETISFNNFDQVFYHLPAFSNILTVKNMCTHGLNCFKILLLVKEEINNVVNCLWADWREKETSEWAMFTANERRVDGWEDFYQWSLFIM